MTVSPEPLSRRGLNTAVAAAVGMSALILVVAVLPAERGIDITGLGRVLGLTQMGAMKVAQRDGAGLAATATAGDSVTTLPDGARQVRMVIGPFGGREAKAVMAAGVAMTYQWATDGQPVEFEFHGDPERPSRPGDYTSYARGTASHGEGRFTAGFAGRHGWFWKNTGTSPVVITATVRGPVERFAPLGGPTAGATTTAASGTVGDATPYDTRLPMKRFMAEVMSHAAQQTWKRQGYVSDDKGLRSLFPRTDQEWQEARNDAQMLAELSNVLLIPGRRVDQPAWTEAVLRLRAAALRVAETTGRRNDDTYMAAGMEINDACNACHKVYAPGVD
ncbi:MULTISPECIES: hypothetical protein [unclassified Novosphingobium]|uniref:hypothetical protein n=1 Tax=unclassified Novosphingobium TaxID=2644732 RepID=UPI00180CB4F5|nr:MULTISPECIES: hypothetical protein [unclassified Novosphingobium]NMN04571.1 hypothetical protein [Novosphingobium sp. SG919]NMN85436.1 hypothetical protein [Novosphingobium sp. SG916]